ncbi:unnamed protein product [Paramecium sonneborni]|uniref:Uncharacterized protein n=1 Tax=Paramecium sonneborni TaxID=65129 RepID=A0A8S1QUE8_9CILI|nr:unnamed protein product [Paramecium sonneborni]
MGYSKQGQINVTIIQRMKSGGGFYDLEGNQKKIGKWIESDKFFQAIKQVTYTGEYNINCMKVGRWDIMFTKSINQPYQQIIRSGGGSYDQEGNQKKIGKWIEQDKFFQAIKQVIYTGEYNINGMKVGKWDIQFQRLFGDKYEQINIQQFACLYVLVVVDLMIKKEIRIKLESGSTQMKSSKQEMKSLMLVSTIPMV